MEDKFYKITIACTNCGHEDTVEIVKGMPVSSESCPNCGNQTVHRVVRKDPYEHIMKVTKSGE